MIKKNLLLVLLFLFVAIMQVQASSGISPKKLKVLYVGYSPDRPLPDYYTAQLGEENFKDYQTRMPLFEAMLKNYFTVVGVVDGRDYTEKMSNEYDVTIFDALPNPIEKPMIEKDPEVGYTTKIIKGKFLSEEFDRPTVFISHVADEMGNRLGLKLDWYCLCLFEHALNIRTEHPIFHKPFKVDITLQERPTPDLFYKYSQDWVLPRTIPMWRVAKDGCRIGMVAGWYGFSEGNDTEIMSGGHCMKAYENVAIGRHGNFLLWGFAAAPDMMTEEAQTVFANAIYYMLQFAGKKPVVRKFNYPALREKISDFLTVLTPEGYEIYKKGVNAYNLYLENRKKEIVAGQKKGTTLSVEDEKLLKAKPMVAADHLEYVKQNSQYGLIYDYQLNIAAVRKYLEENMEFFYGGFEANGNFFTDEDVKSLGISNRDLRLLDECIKMLETNRDKEKAFRILKRYTFHEYTSAKEWRLWYEKNKKKLFFSEMADYKFMGDGSQCVDYLQKKQEEKNRPVNITARQITTDGNTFIEVAIKIKEGYHIYASAAGDAPFILTNVTIRLPEGMNKIGMIKIPASELYDTDSGIRIYKDEVVFRQQIQSDLSEFSGGKIQCEIEYQCCDANSCLPPEKETHGILVKDVY